MNLILFSAEEAETSPIRLRTGDPRVVHLLKILKAKEGTLFDAGIIDGAAGKAVVAAVTKDGVEITFSPEGDPPPLHPLTLILGLSRPQTVKKVLKEATALGVSGFIITGTQRGEKGYAESSALKPESIRKILIEGAQQAFCTRLPEVEITPNLDAALRAAAQGEPPPKG